MSQQALPRRRVVSPPLIPATESPRLSAGASRRLWPNLPPQTQVQLARILAELLRRTLPATVTPGREISRVDHRQRR
jgi:hypothetical protein